MRTMEYLKALEALMVIERGKQRLPSVRSE